MAKRKSKKAHKRGTKKKMKLETVFDCPFCSHVNSVECTMLTLFHTQQDHIHDEQQSVFDAIYDDIKCGIRGEREKHTGFVECKICKSGYESFVTDLTEPTDIFHDWIDHCEYLKNPEDSDA